MCSRDTSDYIEFEVPTDEDFLAFPQNPPNSPAETTKLAFKDKISFIIPKLKKQSGYTGKTCIKHHSILCKICPLLKRARIQKFKLLHKRLQSTAASLDTDTNAYSSVSCTDDPISVGDPKNFSNDPKNSVDDPVLPRIITTTASFNTVNTEHTIHTSDIKINTVSGPSASDHHIDSINKQSGSTTCSSCATCCCPRGNFKVRKPKHRNLGLYWVPPFFSKRNHSPKGPIPNLLDLPIIVPPKYCRPLLNH